MPPAVTPPPASAKARALPSTPAPAFPKIKQNADYEDAPITYLFGLGDGAIVIEGHSMAMFINHSCDANWRNRRDRRSRLDLRHQAHTRGALKSHTTIAFTTAAMTQQSATAAHGPAAAPCTLLRKFAAASVPRKLPLKSDAQGSHK